MKIINKKIRTVKSQLFVTLCVIVIAIILGLIIINSVILEQYYLYFKSKSLKLVYRQINSYYNSQTEIEDLENELNKISINNNFEIVITDNNNNTIYISSKDFIQNITIDRIIEIMMQKKNQTYTILEKNDNIEIQNVQDNKTHINYILLTGNLDNGYHVYIRIPIASIQESVKISNRFLYVLAGIVIVIGGIAISFVSSKFSKPISELNIIAKKMSNLDFSQKYVVIDDDEINDLGKSINTMSDKLEKTINQLRETNFELEKDIEQKSKIDEMRKSFISDVSHELKTPIALIQGYSEGLLENVNTDEESRKYYAEVILDESNKMDKLVKQLLELMKLEYSQREFNNKPFDIVEMEKEIVRASKVMSDEQKIEIRLKEEEIINAYADEFYINQVITNYLTNAIKNCKEVKGEKYIQIRNEQNIEKNLVRITVFNTGDNISEENLTRIWNRFFKADESRNREDGGTGIGLSIVKAIMNNYQKDYGVINKENGVEFYFEIQLVNK